MARAIKTKIPGTILVRETKNGKEYLYIKPFGTKGNYKALGLSYNKKNLKVAEAILEHKYKEYLINSKQLEDESGHRQEKNVYILFKEFLEVCHARKLSEQTIYEYELSYNHIISKEFDIDELESDYENSRKSRIYKLEKEVKDYLIRTKHNNNTINKHLRQFQLFINFLGENGLIKNINLYKKHKRKTIPKEVVSYSAEEAKAILEYARNTDEVFYLLIKLYYLTGGRLGEWLNAYFNKPPYSVDLENKLIRFRNKIRKDLFQTIPIFPELEEVLLRLREIGEEEPDYDGKVVPYSPKNKGLINKKLNKIENALGIKKKGRSTHGFRRLLATELFKNEVPLDIIKDVMRHSSIDVTLKAYREFDNNRVRKSMEGLKRG
ncbi:MAG: tyrosine-type recombinase/integrase [Chlorobiota bacterium]